VAEIFPELVFNDEEGRPFTVRYHLLTPLLLGEIQRQEGEIAKLRASTPRSWLCAGRWRIGIDSSPTYARRSKLRGCWRRRNDVRSSQPTYSVHREYLQPRSQRSDTRQTSGWVTFNEKGRSLRRRPIWFQPGVVRATIQRECPCFFLSSRRSKRFDDFENQGRRPMTNHQQDGWPVSWEEHRQEQARIAAQTTVEQRLLWLEQALRLAEATGALQRRRDEESGSARTGADVSRR